MNHEMEFDINVHIRWMIRRDMGEVLDIEQASFEFPWLEEAVSYTHLTLPTIYSV